VLRESYRSFRAVGWVGTDLLVRWIHPVTGNEAVIGLDVNAEPIRAAAYARAGEQGDAFTPPVRFVQGGQGVLGIIPIRNEGGLSGYTYAAIDLDVLFGQEFLGVAIGHTVTITAGGAPVITLGDHQAGQAVSASFVLGGVDWRVSLTAPATDNTLPHLALALGGALSVMLGLALLDRWLASSTAARAQSAADALARSEARHRAIVETAVDAIVVTDSRGTVRSFNPAAERLFGYAAAEVCGRNVAMLMPEEHARVHDRYMKRYAETGQRHIIGTGRELEGRRRDGTLFPFEVEIGEWDAGGERFFAGLMRDVTERKRAEADLRNSERRYRFLAETIPQIVWTAGPEGAIDYFNPRCSEFTGEPQESALRGGWEIFIHPDERDPSAAAWRRCVTDGTALDVTHRLRSRSGGYRWLRSRAAPLIDTTGQVAMWVGTSHDIHDERVALERLNARTRELDELNRTLDLAPVLIRDLTDRVTYWTSGTCTLYGWTSGETVGRVSHELLATKFPEDPQSIRKVLLDRGAWRGELTHRRKDGSEIDVDSLWVLHRGPAGEPRSVIEVNRDITARKEAEREVRRLNADLERRVEERTRQLADANAELQGFAHNVAHDLRAPLRGMQGFSQALVEDYGPSLDETAQDYLARISDSAARMDLLIQDLLSYAKISREELRLTPVSMTQAVNDALRQLDGAVRESGADFGIEEPLPTVMAHRGVLVQMLANLFSNAMKFIEPGRSPRIRVRSENLHGRARLWVEDNGIGIAPEHRTRIFQVFQRLHGLAEYPGTGIGLAIVRRGAERMGGDAGVESGPGKGSRFWIELVRTGDDR
jgi:PAS domain S-box-containing protein